MIRTGYAICPNSPDQEHAWITINQLGHATVIRLCEHCGKHPTDVLVGIADDA